MIISSSTVDLNSQYRKTVHTETQQRLRLWIDNPGRTPRQPADPASARFNATSTTQAPELSARAQALQPVKRQVRMEAPDDGAQPLAETKMQALVQLIERLTGKRVKLFDARDLHPGNPSGGGAAPPSGPGLDVPGAGFGLEYDHYSARLEVEQSHFSAQGRVQTADGREVQIDLSLNMSRRFLEEQHLSIRAGAAAQRLKDPLVLNFNGTAAELSETGFRFDLDADGREDQIALLDGNSGFLALDRNHDGRINDGSELFGAQSGDGFADLAAYDADGNHWIDAADPIYSKLRIWSRDAQGKEQLLALGQQGVGAIYLGNVTTPFDLTTPDNALLGQVAATGLFLNEDGSAGTVQQLNLVV